MVASELQVSRKKFKSINSYHEGYAVILEELDEFWAEVRQQPGKRNLSRMLRELVQIGAMVQRTAEDGGLILDKEGKS